jgi:hypothetical protein
MVPFNLEFEFDEGHVSGTAEQLDQLTDKEGFMRYLVTAGDRHSIVCVNIEVLPQLPLTPQDAENYYETIHYPEHLSGFSEEEVFTPKEISMIAAAIQAYNNSRKLKFDQMHFDF